MASFDQPRQPESDISPWVRRFGPQIPEDAEILDVAAGRGRHTRWLLERGYRITAVDIDTTKLTDLATHPHCVVLEQDLEAGDWPFAAGRFGGIIVSNYLHRPHFPHLADSLAPGGLLIFDTFAQGNERFGKPRNPNFLLAPGELLSAFDDRLQILAYEHGHEEQPRPAVRQRLCAARTGHPEKLSLRAP